MKIPSSFLNINELGGETNQGALFKLDQLSGIRNLVSDFGNEKQGPKAPTPIAGAWFPANTLAQIPESVLVLTEQGGSDDSATLTLVDPKNGHRMIFSDFGNPAQGVLSASPRAIVSVPPTLGGTPPEGAVLVLVSDIGDGIHSGILTIDATGYRRIAAVFDDGYMQEPWEPTDMIYLPASSQHTEAVVVGGNRIREGEPGVLIRINLANLSSTPLTDLADPGQGWIPPLGANRDTLITGVTVSPQRKIYVLVRNLYLSKPYAFIVRVDPLTSQRHLVSDLKNGSQGPIVDGPAELAWLPNGSLVLAGAYNGTKNRGAIFLVEPATGMRTLLSDLGATHQGPLGLQPSGFMLPQ